jgi:cytochrome P450
MKESLRSYPVIHHRFARPPNVKNASNSLFLVGIHSPAPVGQFLVDEPGLELDGRKVAPGTTLTALTRYASRQFYKDPDVFRPERWIDDSDKEVSKKFEPELVSFYRSVFFGGGARICPGRNLALTEGSALLSAICRHYRIENVMTEDPIEVVSFVMQPTKVTLKFIPRN